MPPLAPVTPQLTGPPDAVTVTVQLWPWCMEHPDTTRVPGGGGGGGAAWVGDGGDERTGDIVVPGVLCPGVGVGVGVPLELDGVGLGEAEPRPDNGTLDAAEDGSPGRRPPALGGKAPSSPVFSLPDPDSA